MSATIMIEIVKAIHELKGHFDTIDKYQKGVERAKKGKRPIPPSGEIQRALNKLKILETSVAKLARDGLGQPKQTPISVDQLANPQSRSTARQGLRENLRLRDEFIKDAKNMLERLKQVEAQADARAKALRELSKFFEEMVKAPLPDIGTVNKAYWFGQYRTAERASAYMGNIGRSAKKAIKRCTAELKTIETETENLRHNLKTFG